MSKNTEKGFFENHLGNIFGEEAGNIGKDFDAAVKDTREILNEAGEVLKDAREDLHVAAKKAENLAAKATIKGEELYKNADIENRLYAAGAGAKIGATLGARAGLPGAVTGAKIGAVVGFVGGNGLVTKFKSWKETKKEEFSNDGSKPEAPPPKPPEL